MTQSEASLVQTFALLGTASAAARVMQAVSERRAGRDPSDQEDLDDARRHLLQSARDLQDLLFPLLVGAVSGPADCQDDERTAIVKRFEELHRLAEASSLLHRIHQRLLSLYPGVSEELLEEARDLRGQSAGLSFDLNDYEVAQAVDFIERALQFSLHVSIDL